jgi:hypothetical protein
MLSVRRPPAQDEEHHALGEFDGPEEVRVALRPVVVKTATSALATSRDGRAEQSRTTGAARSRSAQPKARPRLQVRSAGHCRSRTCLKTPLTVKRRMRGDARRGDRSCAIAITTLSPTPTPSRDAVPARAGC